MIFGRVATAAVLSALVVIAVAREDLARDVIMRLETRFPVPPDCALRRAKGIIVLGGSTFDFTQRAAAGVVMAGSAQRITTAAALTRRFPDLRLVFTGAGESEAARSVFRSLGIAEDRLLIEPDAVDTVRNAALTANLLRPKSSDLWVLDTSAYHMPRAVGLFRRAGFTVIPYPVGRVTGGDAVNVSSVQRVAVHEIVGMALNRLGGRSDSLYPAPDPSVTTCTDEEVKLAG